MSLKPLIAGISLAMAVTSAWSANTSVVEDEGSPSSYNLGTISAGDSVGFIGSFAGTADIDVWTFTINPSNSGSGIVATFSGLLPPYFSLSIDGGAALPSANYYNFGGLGDGTHTLTLTGSNAAYIGAVTAVPEAETYAMLLAGLGLMGGIARRRQLKR